MRARQRELAADAVLEGRDTGSVVWPDADIKVFLVASRGRARRAARGRARGCRRRRRPRVDRRARRPGQRAARRRPPDATVIDTSRPDAEQVVERIVSTGPAAARVSPMSRRPLLARRAALGRAAVQGRAADPHAGRENVPALAARCCSSPTTSRCGTSRRSARPSRGRSATWPSRSCSRPRAVRARSCGWAGRSPSAGASPTGRRCAPCTRRSSAAAASASSSRATARTGSRRPRPAPAGWPWSRTRPSCRWRSGAADWRPGRHDRGGLRRSPAATSAAAAGPAQAYRETADELMAEIRASVRAAGVSAPTPRRSPAWWRSSASPTPASRRWSTG